MLDAATGWIVGSNGAILRTTDGGELWSPQVSNTTYMLRGVSFLDSSFGIATGEGGTILRTTDGGAEWQVIRTDWMDVLRSVRVLDAQHACAVGTNAIFQPFTARTTDGGLNWTFGAFYIQSNEGGLTDVDFIDTQNGFASAYLWDGRGAICRTTNGGASWAVVTVVAWALYGIDFASAQVGVAAGLDGNVLRSTDGGITWNSQTIGLARDLVAVSFPAEATGWVIGEAGCIARTTDGGAHWTQQTGGGASWLRDIECVSASIGTLAGDGSVIRRTTTGGQDPAGVEVPGGDFPGGDPPGGVFPGGDVLGERILALSPNPSANGTTISFAAPAGTSAAIDVFDLLGRRVRTLSASAGDETGVVRWDGRDARGLLVPAGVYFVTIEGGAGQRLLIVR
jgi:photosystem II stability/assembly factor-like uncharacterized protein